MATHDYVISNGTGSAVRSDINGALAAIVSQNSNASEPATMYAYQWWADTTTGLLKIRNAANSAWVTIGTLASANLGLLPLAGGTMTGVLAVTAGTAALPGIAVSGDLNTGLVSPGADQLAITTGGTSRLSVSTTAVSSTLAVDHPLGAVGTPSITFTGDLNTGIYSPGADQIGIATGGTARIVVDASGNVNINSGTFYVDGANNRVGIGTTSPGARCQISTTNVNNVNLALSGPTADNNWGGYLTLNSNNGTTVTAGIQTSINGMFFYFGGSERARIDSSGRLLVGTSSSRAATSGNEASVQIEKVGTGVTGQALSATDNRPEQYGPVISLIKSRGSALGSFTVVQNNDEIGGVSFIGTDGSKGLIGARIEAFVDGTPGANDMPGRLVFSTTADGASSPTPRAQIDSVGRSFFFSSGNGILSTTTAAAGTTTTLFSGNHSSGGGFTGGSASVYIWSNGNIQNTNNSYGAISDLKLKENIVDANSQWNDLKALQVRKYNFKEGQTHTQIGLVAQEVELVSPGLVSESPDRDEEGNDLGTVTKAVNYSVLYMKAVKALQEAMERIEQLETEMAEVKAQLQAS